MLLLICCVAAGCDTRAQVTGKVTYPDGSPLTVGQVQGYGDGVHVRGQIGEDGTFELYEATPGDRVPAGRTYLISIVNTEVADLTNVPTLSASPDATGGVAAIRPRSIQHVDPKFNDDRISGLELVIPKSSKPVEYNIEVTKP